MIFSPVQATDFMGEIRRASVILLKHLGVRTSPGGRVREWLEGHAIGVTEHYTAGTGWSSTCNWLNGTANTGSSCHFLIADRMPTNIPESVKAIMARMGLKVLVIMLSDGLSKGTWHGNWSNSRNVGIENRNAGCLKFKDSKWYWWPKNWTTQFPHEELGKTPQLIDGRYWEPYTVGQIEANILVCQALFCMVNGDMDRRWFLPHSAFSQGKMDTGRAFPLDLVREAVFEQRPIDTLNWLAKFEADPVGFVDDMDEDMDLEFMEELAWRQEHRDEDLPEDGLLICEEIPSANLQQLVQAGKWKDELDAVRRGLDMLGYVVGGAGPELDKDTALAVWMLQKCMGLKADKIPGDITQKALKKRLEHFDLWKE